MDDDLIDDARISLRRRTQLPGKGFFYPDSLDEERADERVRETVEGAEAVVIADGDADGLGCVALIRETRDAALDVEPFEAAIAARLAREREREPGRDAGDAADDAGGDGVGADAGTGAADADTDGEEIDADAADVEAAVEAEIGSSPVAVVRTSPHSMAESFERVAAYADPGVDVYVCDLCPDTVDGIAEPLAALVERAGSIRWFDHHQWDEAVAAAVGEHGVDLVVGASDEECSTDVALRSLDYEFPERFRELAAVTRDHDLWLREDPRSDDLADYAYWAGGEEYATVVGHYGADLPASVHEFVEARRVEKERRIDVAVERAEFHDVGPWTVAATYGRCSQNEVAERLRVAGADAAVIVKPAGSASIRGSESFERCHEVAGQVNGGGHPKAAGCKPDVYDDMLDYAHHWTTGGRTTKRVILQAFERVAEAVDADAEADSDEGGEDEVTTTDDVEDAAGDDTDDVEDAAGDDTDDEGIETDR